MAIAASFDHSDTNKNKTVCVMDASGPLGSALVDRLLRIGFIVHAAVHGNGELMLNGYDKKKVKIFNSDPLDYQSIIYALRGCRGLFYTFEPPHSHDQPTFDEMRAEVEIRAAHNVMEACAQTETIEKVVFTSSVTAVIWREDRYSSTLSDFDEKYWTDPLFCRKFQLWHGLSKTLSEKTAWAMAMDRGVNMVSINAGILVTPDLAVDHPYLKGAAEMYRRGLFVTVDLNFLVEAHISVFQDVSSYGRYICFNHIINRHEDAADLARKLTASSPQSEDHSMMGMVPQRISNNKLNKLMGNFKGSEDLLD